MNILMIVFNTLNKGTYWRALHLARQLVVRGHHVTLLATDPCERRRFGYHVEQGVAIAAAPALLTNGLRSGWDGWAALARTLWVHGQSFDLVHAFECRPTVLVPALVAGPIQHTPLVIDWCDWFGRGGSVEERPNPLVRWLLRPVETWFEEQFRTLADGTTVICSTLNQKAQQLGVLPHTILQLCDGADVVGLRPGDRTAARCRLDLPPNAPLIGYVGAIFRRDAELLAQAFDQVCAQRGDARLVLIGYVNQPVEQWTAHQANIVRTGTIAYPQLSEWLAACDVCWLPYCDTGANQGRWPLKFNDYMAAGRATVATAVGDVATVLRQHEVGVLAAPSPTALAQATLALLANEAQRVSIEATARNVAETVFDWRLRALELEALYVDVLMRYEPSRSAP